ncbi:branched-chain amino acid transaminase [Pigmentiphaga soli]|uniref:Branched-chain-amino-acid aminotransferase n=1 Tax=Pigmentiphaga soli TaxID=1007095 RepID=A0ABP8GER0_9BURK
MQRDTPAGEIWMDGEFLPFGDAAVHVLTHTLHYGLGAFEGLRVYDGELGPAIFRLRDHTDRLFDSAHILGLELPFTREALMDAQAALVRRNGLRAGYLRPLVFLGDEKRGLDPTGARVHVSIACWPWGAYLGEGAMERGIRVKVSSLARHHVNVQMCRSKSVSTYANSILASREVRADGYDEALLLDTEGFVAEGAGENLFIVRRGVLYEPDVTSALDGITRRTVIELAREEGWQVASRRLTRDEVYIADEAFFTGTAAEVTPIVEIDRRRIGSGTPGPFTRRLQQRYHACVHGEEAGHREWLTPVR